MLELEGVRFKVFDLLKAEEDLYSEGIREVVLGVELLKVPFDTTRRLPEDNCLGETF